MTTKTASGLRFSCLPENLIAGLATVSKAVPTKPALSILTHVLISTDRGGLRLSANNLDFATSCWIGGKVENEGAIALPYSLLSRLANSLVAIDDKIDVSLTPKGMALIFKCGTTESRISGMDANDFPPIPETKQGVRKVEPTVLRSAIKKVAFAAAPSVADKPILTGVLMEFSEDSLTLVGADGYLLAIQKIKGLVPQEARSILVPASALLELGRLLADQSEPIEITADNSRIAFGMKNVEFTSQLLQGKYPNYRQLVPQSPTSTKTTVNLAELRTAVKRASIFAGDRKIRIYANEQTLRVSAHRDEMGRSDTEVTAITVGDASKIALKDEQVGDVMAVLDGDNVTIEIVSPFTPCVFTQDSDKDYLCVVMPMHDNWAEQA